MTSKITVHDMSDWDFNKLIDAISQYRDFERKVSAKEKPDTFQWSKYREAQRTEAERAMSVLLGISEFRRAVESES